MDLKYACPHCGRIFDAAGAREHNLLIGMRPMCQGAARMIAFLAHPPRIFPLTTP